MPTINKNKKKYKKTGVSSFIYENCYNTAQWRKMRKMMIMQNPLCQKCLENDIISIAKEVHHKKPISSAKTKQEMFSLMFDYNNLICLCEKCHHEIHKLIRKRK